MSVSKHKLYEIMGISRVPTSHTEKIVSGIGGFLAILGILIISKWSVGAYSAAIIVASMGASAVLLFAVPHGPLSQPWPIFAGHIASAIVGVTCAKYISGEVLAASVAVGAAIIVMYYLQCIHPPGGATALSAVMGGEAVHELGYQYVITPIFLNVIIIILIGIVFNAFFPWRRYPTFWHKQKTNINNNPNEESSNIRHEDFVYALSQIDSFIDINEHDLLRVYDIAVKKSNETTLSPEKLIIGGFYSNGQYGNDWSVRQIVDESDTDNKGDSVIVYKVVAGNGRRSSGYSPKSEFLRWTKHQVIRDEENWKRVGGTN